MFLKQKRDGSIKGRGCADGRKQRIWQTKADISSPTVSTEALFLTSVIDALEERDVATADIPNFFLQTPADKSEQLIIQLDRHIAGALLRIYPDKYKTMITYEKGKPVIYGEANKAIYGTLNAAILAWKNLSKYLVDKMGFKLNLNPYD